jgi:hypothetical protein
VNEPFGQLRRPGFDGSSREVAVHRARKDGRSVAVLRVIDSGDSCVVEAEVYANRPGAAAVRPGPYRFATVSEATAFVSEAAEALSYLGCEIS